MAPAEYLIAVTQEEGESRALVSRAAGSCGFGKRFHARLLAAERHRCLKRLRFLELYRVAVSIVRIASPKLVVKSCYAQLVRCVLPLPSRGKKSFTLTTAHTMFDSACQWPPSRTIVSAS